jgi:cobalt-zinc-cadmium efflux system outer membrane protein
MKFVRNWGGFRFPTGLMIVALSFLPAAVPAQTALTWKQVKEHFEATNPNLKAAQLNVDESRAVELTAFFRPNPDFTLSTDGAQLSPYRGIWRPFAGTEISTSLSYLHEREQKRELRRASARESTAIVESTYLDQQRGLLFNLRNAFVQTLQAKAVLENARENLAYWDRELSVNRSRWNSGDLARIDLNRMELQRVQFESDFETAVVNLRTAKTQLLLLLSERTPLEQFDASGRSISSRSCSPSKNSARRRWMPARIWRRPSKMWNSPRSIIVLPWPTDLLIPLSAAGGRTTLRSITCTTTTRWVRV